MILEMMTIVLDAQIINYTTQKIMKNNTLLLFILGFTITVSNAQSISKQVIGTLGQTLTNTNLKLSYTIQTTKLLKAST